MKLTIVFDNYAGPEDMRTGWGFSCYVQLPATTVLFDTGADGDALVDNMLASDLEPDEIDLVVLSHIHGDHAGGLSDILALNRGVTVCVPPCFPERIISQVERAGGTVMRGEPGQTLAPHVMTTGEVSGPVDEQGLVLETAEGLIVITGCAHPGVDAIVAAANERCEGTVRTVIGGFHLKGTSRTGIEEIARSLQEMGVERAGPCHCSGDTARNVFSEMFGDQYLDTHLGSVLTLQLPAAAD